MMEVNQNLPEMEQLRQEEYNLDTDEQKRMQAQQDHEVEKVRSNYLNFLAQFRIKKLGSDC